MNIAIFGKIFNGNLIKYFQELISKLEDNNCNLYFYKPFHELVEHKVKFNSEVLFFSEHYEIKNKVDVLLSIGGDGTLLDTITLIRDSNIPILGINLGRLGFLSSVSKDEISTSMESVLNGNYSLDKRTLIKLETKENLFGDLNFALNELTIHKKDNPSLIVIHVSVDEHFLNSYWADGLIVSTPTGSTGYSLSCQGPIVAPGADNFIINPIASHNLTVRPIVIPDNSIIKINIEGRNKEFSLGLDSRFKTIDSSVELIIKKENFCINLINMPEKDFFSTIREKLKWGLDVRN